MSCRSTPGNSALTSYAQACTGLNEGSISQVFHALKREGAHLPAPTQTDAQEFLANQEFTVRNDETLPVARKASIVNRLHNALTRVREGVLPDGGTFHAWKNVLAESWSHSTRKIAAITALTTLSVTLTGCGGAAIANQDAHDTPRPTAITSPSAAHPVPSDAPPIVPKVTFSGPPMEKYGQKALQEAYAEAVTLATEVGLDRNTMTATKGQRVDVSYADKWMTPDAAAGWAENFNSMLKGNTDATGIVNAFSLYNVLPSTVKAPTDRPMISNIRISGASGALSPDGSLRLKIQSDFHIRFVSEGVAKYSPVTRNQTFTMIRNTGPTSTATPWLISGWEGSVMDQRNAVLEP